MSNLNHVLNLVRHEAESAPATDDPFPMNENRARALIEGAALLIRRACLASPETLTRLSDEAMYCQGQRVLAGHCGNCASQTAPCRVDPCPG
jgi:hypothetical protein